MIYAHLTTPKQRSELARLLDGGAPDPAPPRWTVDPLPQDAPHIPRRRSDAEVGPYVAIGDRIRRVREHLGLRQVDLARKLGLGQMTLVRAEREAWMPRLAVLQPLAELVSVDWLVRGDPT